MRLPRLRYTVRWIMAAVLASVVLTGVAITWRRVPEPPRAPAPSESVKDPVLMEGVDINSNGAGPPGLDRQESPLPLLPPDLQGSQRP